MAKKDERIHIGHLGVSTSMLMRMGAGVQTLETKCGARRDMSRIAREPKEVTCMRCAKNYVQGLRLGAPPVIWLSEIRGIFSDTDAHNPAS